MTLFVSSVKVPLQSSCGSLDRVNGCVNYSNNVGEFVPSIHKTAPLKKIWPAYKSLKVEEDNRDNMIHFFENGGCADAEV